MNRIRLPVRLPVRLAVALPVALAVIAGLVCAGLGVHVAAASLHPSTAIYATESHATGSHATGHARSVDAGGASGNVVWLLVLGSDARPGQSVTGSRADSIHLVGVNTTTGAGIALGIPRDSYVPIAGHGKNKINAAMAYGGPDLMAHTIAEFSGIEPDYVIVTGFEGFKQTVNGLGGLDIDVPQAVHAGGANVDAGHQHLNGHDALWYGRARHGVPGGDFGRSMHQGAIMVAALRQLQEHASPQTKVGAALDTLMDGVAVKMSPAQAYRLYQAGMAARPGKIKNCVLPGGFGWAGSMSIVEPDRDTMHAIAADVRDDATLSGSCPDAF